jgi:hypothetical protein
MNPSQFSPVELCRSLAEGWSVENPDAPRELFTRLRRSWHANMDREKSDVSTFRAVMELNQVRLLGASELGCLVLGKGAAVEREVGEFWRQQGGGGRLVMVLAATTALKEAAQRFAPADRCVFLGNGEIETLLTHPKPLELLKDHLRRQIPLHRLLPYDTIHPAAPNMFFGRRDILNRFHQEETTSFAIAGPGRIGKSSLLKQYRRELRWNLRDERRNRLFMIDCYPYGGFEPDKLAQRIALDISADSEANRVNAKTLLRFLKRHSSDGEQPLELLFDEVDGVCRSEVMDELAEAVRTGYCRVILCGKSRLFALMNQCERQFAGRLERICPEPLDVESAARLLMEPLADLGVVFQDAAAALQTVFQLTARRPHLIQECARTLFQFAQADKTSVVSAEHLQQLREQFMETAYAMLPLEAMQDDLTRLLALLWLREGGGPVNVGSFQKLADKYGLALSAAKTLHICEDLWICNVLTRERGTLTLASPHLVEFVRKMDFNTEIARLIQTASKPCAPAADQPTHIYG